MVQMRALKSKKTCVPLEGIDAFAWHPALFYHYATLNSCFQEAKEKYLNSDQWFSFKDCSKSHMVLM